MEEGRNQSTDKPVPTGGLKTKDTPGNKEYKAMSPMQQKDKKIQELRRKVKSLEGDITDRESDLNDLKMQNRELRDKLKDVEIKLVEIDKQHDDVTTKLEKLDEEKEDVQSTLQDKMVVMEEMESRLAQQAEEGDKMEKLHQQRYLELYQKGQEAVLIEQEEELVRTFAMEKRDPLTQQLVAKLLKTERKLEKMKHSKREETYRKGPTVASVDHAKMGMLKSALFYYLTGRERRGNLEMVMAILEYSDTHRDKIKHALKLEKKGGK